MDLLIDPEVELLVNTTPQHNNLGPDHSLRTAPILTGDAFAVAGERTFPQRALYGRIVHQEVDGLPHEPRSPKVYINTNAPFSAVVCGVQGSGKSHSTSVLLESCLIQDARLGSLPAPLSGILFHFDTAAGGGSTQPCEAAYLASLDEARGKTAIPPRVTVLVLPTALRTMRRVYAGLPDVRVEPLHFAPEDISGQRLLAMMKVDIEQRMPLYMECIMAILRSMDPFDYARFREELLAQKFDNTQKTMLSLRLALLDACLEGGEAVNRASTHFREGQLTIVDLSSPFMDASSACALFDIVLGLFVEADMPAGKLIVLDEAHKYLTENGSSRLADSLLAVVRQQRHLAARVVISTQEPTVVPSAFLDLCSIVIAHRFSSPRWLEHLAKHVSAGSKMGAEWFAKVVCLRAGEAMLFAPAGLGAGSRKDGSGGEKGAELRPLGQGYLLVRSRLRITRDGGHSVLAVMRPGEATRLGRVQAVGGGRERVDGDPEDGGAGAADDDRRLASPTPSSGIAAAKETADISSRITHDADNAGASDAATPPASHAQASSLPTYAEVLAHRSANSAMHASRQPDRVVTDSSDAGDVAAHAEPLVTSRSGVGTTPTSDCKTHETRIIRVQIPKNQTAPSAADVDEMPRCRSPSDPTTSSPDLTAAARSTSPRDNPELRFVCLVDFLVTQHAAGYDRVPLSAVVHFLLQNRPCGGQTVTEYVDECGRLGLLRCGGEPASMWVRATAFAPILCVLRVQRHNGFGGMSRGSVCEAVCELFPGAAEGGDWAVYCDAAAKAGVISLDGDWVTLRDALPRQDVSPKRSAADIHAAQQHTISDLSSSDHASTSTAPTESSDDPESSSETQPSDDSESPSEDDTARSVALADDPPELDLVQLNRYEELVRVMDKRREDGAGPISATALQQQLVYHFGAAAFRDFLLLAADQRFVRVYNQAGTLMVAPLEFAPLLQVLRVFRALGHPRSWQSETEQTLWKKFVSALWETTFEAYAARAEAQGVISRYAGWIELVSPRGSGATGSSSGESHTSNDPPRPDSSVLASSSMSDDVHRVPSAFLPLARMLLHQREQGLGRVLLSRAGQLLQADDGSLPYTGKLSDYLESAQEAGLVHRGGVGSTSWVELAQVVSAPDEFAPLLEVLRQLEMTGNMQPQRSIVGSRLRVQDPGVLAHETFKEYTSRAMAAGVVVMGGVQAAAWIKSASC